MVEQLTLQTIDKAQKGKVTYHKSVFHNQSVKAQHTTFFVENDWLVFEDNKVAQDFHKNFSSMYRHTHWKHLTQPYTNYVAVTENIQNKVVVFQISRHNDYINAAPLYSRLNKPFVPPCNFEMHDVDNLWQVRVNSMLPKHKTQQLIDALTYCMALSHVLTDTPKQQTNKQNIKQKKQPVAQLSVANKGVAKQRSFNPVGVAYLNPYAQSSTYGNQTPHKSGWKQPPHIRRGFWRTYKKSGNKIWINESHINNPTKGRKIIVTNN